MTKTIVTALLFICAIAGSSLSYAQDQKAIDEKLLQGYFAKNNIKAEKTASGLYYVITKAGTGEKAKAGQKVTVNYRGKFLDGNIFDANVDENYLPTNGRTPLEFTVGQGMVIKGWDEGLQLLNPNSKATLFIPSYLAYGANQRGPIPANSILVFDVQLVGVE